MTPADITAVLPTEDPLTWVPYILVAVLVPIVGLFLWIVRRSVSSTESAVKTLRENTTTQTRKIATLEAELDALRRECRVLIDRSEVVARLMRDDAVEHTNNDVIALIGQAGKVEGLLGDQ